MRQLVLPHGHPLRPVLDDVRSHEHGVPQEAVVAQVLGRDFLLLFLVGGVAFQPAQRSDHGQKQMQFGRFFDFGLPVNGAFGRVQPHGQPVHHHVAHVFVDARSVGVVAGQRVPVGHEEKGLRLVLHGHPVFERSEIMSDVQRTRGPHTRYRALFRRHGVLLLERH